MDSAYEVTDRAAGLGQRRPWLLGGLWVAVALVAMLPSRVFAQDSRVPVPHERVWSMPHDVITRPDVTDRLGRFEKDASGSYNIYDRDGQRVGVGKPRSDGAIELYDARGRHGLEVKPERPERPRRK